MQPAHLGVTLLPSSFPPLRAPLSCVRLLHAIPLTSPPAPPPLARGLMRSRCGPDGLISEAWPSEEPWSPGGLHQTAIGSAHSHVSGQDRGPYLIKGLNTTNLPGYRHRGEAHLPKFQPQLNVIFT